MSNSKHTQSLCEGNWMITKYHEDLPKGQSEFQTSGELYQYYSSYNVLRVIIHHVSRHIKGLTNQQGQQIQEGQKCDGIAQCLGGLGLD